MLSLASGIINFVGSHFLPGDIWKEDIDCSVSIEMFHRYRLPQLVSFLNNKAFTIYNATLYDKDSARISIQ